MEENQTTQSNKMLVIKIDNLIKNQELEEELSQESKDKDWEVLLTKDLHMKITRDLLKGKTK